jgi:hypothetical protein
MRILAIILTLGFLCQAAIAEEIQLVPLPKILNAPAQNASMTQDNTGSTSSSSTQSGESSAYKVRHRKRPVCNLTGRYRTCF